MRQEPERERQAEMDEGKLSKKGATKELRPETSQTGDTKTRARKDTQTDQAKLLTRAEEVDKASAKDEALKIEYQEAFFLFFKTFLEAKLTTDGAEQGRIGATVTQRTLKETDRQRHRQGQKNSTHP